MKCVACRNDAVDGRVRCEACALDNKAAVQKRRVTLRQNGLCGQCGANPLYTRMECYDCRGRRNARERARYAAKVLGNTKWRVARYEAAVES